MKKKWRKRAFSLILAAALMSGDLTGIARVEAAKVQTEDQQEGCAAQETTVKVQTEDQQEDCAAQEATAKVQTKDQQEQTTQESVTPTLQQEEEEATGAFSQPNFKFGTISYKYYFDVEIVKNYRICISWETEAKDSSKPMDTPIRYDIYRSTSKNGTYKKFESIEDEWVYDDSRVKGCYFYQIRAVFKQNGKETYIRADYSVQYTQPKPILSYTGLSDRKPKIDFGSVKQCGEAVETDRSKQGIIVTGYDLYRSTKKNSGYQYLYCTSDRDYIDTSAKKGKTYYYKVRPFAYDAQTKKYTYGITSDPLEVEVGASGNQDIFWDIYEY